MLRSQQVPQASPSEPEPKYSKVSPQQPSLVSAADQNEQRTSPREAAQRSALSKWGHAVPSCIARLQDSHLPVQHGHAGYMLGNLTARGSARTKEAIYEGKLAHRMLKNGNSPAL